jgi:ABC-type antimicrobial peptide transport system permease subunit
MCTDKEALWFDDVDTTYPSSQSRTDSVIEAIINILIGFGLSWGFYAFIINPLFHLHSSGRDSFLITVCFTFLSFVRQYFIRRWLNGKVIWKRLHNA